MPHFIVKVAKDEDLYMDWSTIADAPAGWGSREDMIGFGIEPDRLDRADENGASTIGEVSGWFWWGDDQFIYDQQGMLHRSAVPELLARISEEPGADVSDLLTPFEN